MFLIWLSSMICAEAGFSDERQCKVWHDDGGKRFTFGLEFLSLILEGGIVMRDALEFLTNGIEHLD